MNAFYLSESVKDHYANREVSRGGPVLGVLIEQIMQRATCCRPLLWMVTVGLLIVPVLFALRRSICFQFRAKMAMIRHKASACAPDSSGVSHRYNGKTSKVRERLAMHHARCVRLAHF
jgi:hypothetical protein